MLEERSLRERCGEGGAFGRGVKERGALGRGIGRGCRERGSLGVVKVKRKPRKRCMEKEILGRVVGNKETYTD